jgi:hypothetical protein
MVHRYIQRSHPAPVDGRVLQLTGIERRARFCERS